MKTETHQTQQPTTLTQPQSHNARLRTTDGADFTDKKQETSAIRAIRVIRGLLLSALLLGTLATARADTFTVTTLDDSGPGSLRQTIADAAPGDTINFAVTGTITLTSGELVITNDLTINGPGATNLTVSGNNASRVFSFINVTAAISGLTVSNGRISTTGGAGIANSGGSLIISNCIITENVNDSLSGDYGGGIFNNGDITVVNSTVSNNHGPSYGGGICSWYGSPALRIINSTITGNSAGEGGGLWNGSVSCMITNTTISGNPGRAEMWNYGSTVWLCNSTVSPSTTYYSVSIVAQAASTLHVFNSILAGRLYATAISHDFNLIGDTNSATITGVTAHNIYGKDPLLGPLADNGGPTPTHTLLPGSPAIDHGSSGGLATDQRGLPRPFNFPAYFDADDASDIGAVEMQEGPQPGPVFTVNSNDDVDDGVPGIAHCSLREAINAANANPTTNAAIITFATNVPGLYTGVTGTITLTNGELAITNSVNINGPGAASLTVSGNNASRVFSLTNVTATISGLTVADGNVGSSGKGGGISSHSSSLALNNCTVTRNMANDGSGIFINLGNLAIIQSTICSNVCSSEEWYTEGGGICNVDGILDIRSSAIIGNRGCESGGGIWSNCELRLTNCTVTGNLLNSSRWSNGGGIRLQEGAFIVSSTICSNGQANAGGGIFSSGGWPYVRNSIVAGNNATVSPDYYGYFTSLDYNLIQNTNGVDIYGATTHNIYNQDPKLGPLADLGGPTPTHALRFDSPAIDAGQSSALTTDQRGLPRPIDSPDITNAEGGDGSDIGAYEGDPSLRITGVEKAGGDIRLSFSSMLGRTYRVESTDQLPPIWNELTNGVPGTGGRFQALDGGAASLPQRFYRTVLLQ